MSELIHLASLRVEVCCTHQITHSLKIQVFVGTMGTMIIQTNPIQSMIHNFTKILQINVSINYIIFRHESAGCVCDTVPDMLIEGSFLASQFCRDFSSMVHLQASSMCFLWLVVVNLCFVWVFFAHVFR